MRDWKRPNYTEPGGSPFLFYVLFGGFGAMPALDSQHYACEGMTPGIDVQHLKRSENAELMDSFFEGNLFANLRTERPRMAAGLRAAPECFLVQGEIEDRANLNYLRNTCGLLNYFADNGGFMIYDPLIIKWWDIDEWHEQLVAPRKPNLKAHTVTLVNREPVDPDDPDADPTFWFHTRGMRKFGRPDLSVHAVPADLSDEVNAIIDHFIDFQALGGNIPDEHRFRIDGFETDLTAVLTGDWDDPEFSNLHFEIG